MCSSDLDGNILLSSALGSESTIVYRRTLRERILRIAPFLLLDRDPYIVVADGRLVWIQDAFTYSNDFPYSEPTRWQPDPAQLPTRLNYIRNSVKIAVDAYDGSMQFFVSDPSDPLINSYQAAFPALFRAMSEMPTALQSHLRYPEDLFTIQSQAYATYHMTEPAVFYNREDQWEVPTIDDSNNGQAMQPYYTIMRLPGETDAEFIQMLPFTPRAKDNLSAWLAARSDGEHYGKMQVFQFPKQKVIFGPRQVVARINQDQTISPQITLWNQQGSTVNFGTLLVIPIEESLLYVRPLYLRSSTGKIPELKRVIVAYNNKIVMAETLTRALVEIFDRSVATALAPDRLDDTATSVVASTDAMPDVAAAVPADATLPINREDVAARLGFEGVSANSLDVSSDRDFVLEFAFCMAMIAEHLSTWAEEWILWSTIEFDFLKLPHEFCTGSSIMPQKKNPDVAELVRGKTGRVNGHLVALLTLMKGQPLAYNKDNQEDKEPLFDTIDTVSNSLAVFTEMVPGISVNAEAMRAAAAQGFATATDLADYLVRKGLPFREAHEAVAQAVRFCEVRKCDLADLNLQELRQFSNLIGDDVYASLTLDGAVNARSHIGGTAPTRVKSAIAKARKTLK